MFEKKKTFVDKIKGLFGLLKNEEIFLKLEEILLESDLGYSSSSYVILKLKEEIKKHGLKTEEEFVSCIKNIIFKELIEIELIPMKNELSLYLFLGVNGVGKTTSIAKLGSYYKNSGYKVMFAAGDTFRAAGGAQLKIHGERLNIRTVSQAEGSDPGAVIYDSIASAKSKKDELILADTAGRMHNRADLMKQIEKIDKIVLKSNLDPKNYKKILVLDGNIGQESISQLELFDKSVQIDALILSKFDSRSKGGVIFRMCKDFKKPIAFLGTGEKYEDISLFKKDLFLNKLFLD